MAVAPRGSMYDPSAVFYMEKLVTGPEAADVVDIRLPVAENIRRTAKAKGSSKDDITVVHPRPSAPRSSWSSEIRATGARIKFITDGDVAGAIMAARPDTGIDLLLGVGGTPEGIIAACAMKALGGVIQGRLWPTDDDERQRAIDAGHDLERVLSTDDLVSGDDCFFVATGITDGELLRGVRYAHFGATTHSLVMRSRSGTIRKHHQRAPVREAQPVVALPTTSRTGQRRPTARPCRSVYWRVTSRPTRSSRRRWRPSVQRSRGDRTLSSRHRARLRHVRRPRRPGAAAHHGTGGSADLVGPSSASCSPSAASTSSASTTATSAGRRSCVAGGRRSDVVRGFVRRQTKPRTP